MLQAELVAHPATPCGAIARVCSDFDCSSDGRFVLRFHVQGRIDELRLPPAGPPRREDQLWRHTCGELFVRRAGAAPYAEFNFAPSRAWAAYGFDSYRSGMRSIDISCPPAIESQFDSATWRLLVTGTLPTITAAASPVDLEFACTMVIESASGVLSYWALAHPPGAPDFHHADGFRWRTSAGGSGQAGRRNS